MLTAKQARFVDEYMVCLNGAEAARRAGYSKKTARAIASENLRKPEIAAEIAKRKKKVTDQIASIRPRVIEELARVAFFDLCDLAEKDWRLLPPEEWPPEAWKAFEKVKYRMVPGPIDPNTGKRTRAKVVTSIKAKDKLPYLEMLGEISGLISRRSGRRRKV
jgi:phage terminase small subunit